MAFRFLTGAGIGGEYAAINSTIQELIPARVRGWTDLAINGSFWVGAAMGAAGSIVLLDPTLVAPDLGWRLAFLIGAALSLIIFFMRFWLPESPRWLMTHGRIAEAETIVAGIEADLAARGHPLPTEALPKVRLRARTHTPLAEVGPDAPDRRAAADGCGTEPDGGAGLLLQRHLLHLRPDPDGLLRHRRRSGRLVHPAVRGRQLPGAPHPRSPVRYAGPAADARFHLRDVWTASGGHGLSVRAQPRDGSAADNCLDGDLLLRVGGGERSLSRP